MRRSAAMLLVLAVAASAARSTAQDGGCAGCHSEPATREMDRSHHRAGIGCSDCHGGDAKAASKEAAHAAAAGYRGKIERSALPGLCGDCHADVRRMNPFGLPTDQLAQYRTSQHGEALARGNTAAATCVDCHGAHGIVGARRSDSPVHPRNVAATCGRCHSDERVGAEHGLDTKIEAAWRGSVHAKLLLDQGDASAPQCATCHGNHGAVPPGFAEVGAVCGKCHVRQNELFAKSPHARLVASGEFEACVVCHGNHGVQPASERLFTGTCVLCHKAGDRGLQVRDRLLGQLRTTESRLASAKAELARGQNLGFAHEDDGLLLENARTALFEMQALQHSLDPAALEAAVKAATHNLDRLSERLAAAESLERAKRLTLLPVIVFLVLMSLGFWVRYRRLHDHGAPGTDPKEQRP